MLDPFLQGQIIGMHKAGLKSRKIATDLNVNDRTARAIIKRYQERGTLEPKPIPGRPRNPVRVVNLPSAEVEDAGGEEGAAAGGGGVDGDAGAEGGGENGIRPAAAAETTTTSTGKVIKKRGKRGPYKKREKAQVLGSVPDTQAQELPVFVAPRPLAPEAVAGAGAGMEERDTSVITTIKTIATTATDTQ
ncbi:hypothetical protein BGW39_002333 [Mortierella sp. 14UC]|nr:hypothetical protein BGW39_002333 [Mortierella sp. 14UC]